jgi:cobalt/nickel transport system permease protein
MTHTQPQPWSVGAFDPRLRIVAAVAFAIVVVTLASMTALALALALSIALGLWARLPLGTTLRRLAAIDGLMLVVVLLLPFTVPGTSILTIGAVSASAEGLSHAVAILLKANAVALALLALVSGLTAVGLGHALSRLRVPDALVQLLFFTVRYIDVILGEYARLRTAMRARGFRLANRLHVYQSIGYLIGMLLVRSLERSERILAAMRCRGFDGRFHALEDLDSGPPDRVAAGLAVLILVGLLVIDHGHRHAV